MKTMTTNVMKKFLKKLPKDIENIIKEDIKDIFLFLINRRSRDGQWHHNYFFYDLSVSYKKCMDCNELYNCCNRYICRCNRNICLKCFVIRVRRQQRLQKKRRMHFLLEACW